MNFMMNARKMFEMFLLWGELYKSKILADITIEVEANPNGTAVGICLMSY